jgi:hypothetical protein
MTLKLLQLIISRFPNNFELGELIRKFYFFHKENEFLEIHEIEDRFIKKHINSDISFQKTD